MHKLRYLTFLLTFLAWPAKDSALNAATVVDDVQTPHIAGTQIFRTPEQVWTRLNSYKESRADEKFQLLVKTEFEGLIILKEGAIVYTGPKDWARANGEIFAWFDVAHPDKYDETLKALFAKFGAFLPKSFVRQALTLASGEVTLLRGTRSRRKNMTQTSRQVIKRSAVIRTAINQRIDWRDEEAVNAPIQSLAAPNAGVPVSSDAQISTRKTVVEKVADRIVPEVIDSRASFTYAAAVTKPTSAALTPVLEEESWSEYAPDLKVANYFLYTLNQLVWLQKSFGEKAVPASEFRSIVADIRKQAATKRTQVEAKLAFESDASQDRQFQLFQKDNMNQLIIALDARWR
jgi:hypothetical protein